MTADAAHVAAVAEALAVDDHGGIGNWLGLDEATRTHSINYWTGVATVAVETLTPRIRAQVAAEIRARADEDGDWIGQTDPDSILRVAARIAEATR